MRAVIVFLLAIVLSGCAKIVYVPVESVRHETEYRGACSGIELQLTPYMKAG